MSNNYFGVFPEKKKKKTQSLDQHKRRVIDECMIGCGMIGGEAKGESIGGVSCEGKRLEE